MTVELKKFEYHHRYHIERHEVIEVWATDPDHARFLAEKISPIDPNKPITTAYYATNRTVEKDSWVEPPWNISMNAGGEE